MPGSAAPADQPTISSAFGASAQRGARDTARDNSSDIAQPLDPVPSELFEQWAEQARKAESLFTLDNRENPLKFWKRTGVFSVDGTDPGVFVKGTAYGLTEMIMYLNYKYEEVKTTNQLNFDSGRCPLNTVKQRLLTLHTSQSRICTARGVKD